MDQSTPTQNRRSRRSHLLMTATLEVSGRALVVKLRNLSADGAQVEGEDIPVEGTDLLFRRGELAAAGSIIWTKNKQAGIAFATTLDPDTVLNHIPAPRARMTPDFRRPGLGSRALTEQERMLAESWLALPPAPSISD